MSHWWIGGAISAVGMIVMTASFVYLGRRRPDAPIPFWGWTPWRERDVGSEVFRLVGFTGLMMGTFVLNSGAVNPLPGVTALMVGSLPSFVVIGLHNRRLRNRPSRK